MFYDKDSPWWTYLYPFALFGIAHFFNTIGLMAFFLLCLGAIIYPEIKKERDLKKSSK
jgi:hypothetical protein